MCHAIGQMHEQSRTDRDNYVTMLWQNIRGGRGNNNMAKTSTRDNNPYDHESVLQYGLFVSMLRIRRVTCPECLRLGYSNNMAKTSTRDNNLYNGTSTVCMWMTILLHATLILTSKSTGYQCWRLYSLNIYKCKFLSDFDFFSWWCLHLMLLHILIHVV